MLYVSVNNKKLTYTAFQALTLDMQTADDMLFPIRLPYINEIERNNILNMKFERVVTYILNKFFPLFDKIDQLQSCLREFCPHIEILDRKTRIISYKSMKDLERKIATILTGKQAPLSLWACCALRISMLFGVYSNIDVPDPDFAICTSDPISYLSILVSVAMGLPAGKIICGSECEDSLCRYMRSYIVGLDLKEFYDFVVSERRAEEIVKGVLGSYKQQICKSAAFSYGALQDYRATIGDHRHTVLMNEL